MGGHDGLKYSQELLLFNLGASFPSITSPLFSFPHLPRFFRDHLSHPTKLNATHIVTLQFEPKPTAGRPPAARGYHVSLLADGRLFVFGGFDGHSVYDDVWILDLAGAAYLPQVTSFQLLIE